MPVSELDVDSESESDAAMHRSEFSVLGATSKIGFKVQLREEKIRVVTVRSGLRGSDEAHEATVSQCPASDWGSLIPPAD